jgi:hypothetical protein
MLKRRKAGERDFDAVGYLNDILKNTVISPPEIKVKGLAYFDELDDCDTPDELANQVLRFLKPNYYKSRDQGEGQS